MQVGTGTQEVVATKPEYTTETSEWKYKVKGPDSEVKGPKLICAPEEPPFMEE